MGLLVGWGVRGVGDQEGQGLFLPKRCVSIRILLFVKLPADTA